MGSSRIGLPPWTAAVAVGVVVAIHTAYGGLSTSIYIDRTQFLALTPVVLPLVIVAAVTVGGKADIWSNAGEAGPIPCSAPDGYFFAIVLISGIVASNAFHPGMWQRVYTIESQRSLNRTLWTAVAITIPLTSIMALAGVAAVDNGSVAPFQYSDVALSAHADLRVDAGHEHPGHVDERVGKQRGL